MIEILIGIFSTTIRLAIPVLFVALGEIFVQRSGMLNLGLEGLMLIGASCGFTVTFLTGNPLLGILSAMLLGGLVCLLMGYFSITLGVNQIIAGIAIWILGMGLSSFMYRIYVLPGLEVFPTITPLPPVEIPVLSQIPALGEILFKHNILVYFALLLVPLSIMILFRTTIGLKITAVGENPRAADSVGINVHRIRYLCIIIGGVMAGLGGAYLTVADLGAFMEGMVAGRGWIAFALIAFGMWNPLLILVGCLIFGGAQAFQFRLQAMGVGIPYFALLIMPYVVILTTLVLMAKIKKRAPPAAMTLPYKRE